MPRKPRPLVRDAATLRDDRLFLLACDDRYAPKQYFDFFRIARIQVHVIPTEDGTSSSVHVLDRLLAIDYEPGDQRWLVLDTDHYTQAQHVASFQQTLQRARQVGVNVALSRPCFETWLLLHHTGEEAVIGTESAGDIARLIRSHRGEYNKTKLKREHYPIESVIEAIGRAARLDSQVTGGDIPQATTTRVHKIWHEIIKGAHPTQLPKEFVPLRGTIL
ncbi:RloB family protein [uncultured Paludibaculum sp.]|uniref:RloB family protein n=1 Tax=uncultured Paludibaculum sp. TaxID=1765020 RepID=UPI002AAC2EBC|nr:RloB family protein [uncultured Paludibaculum sp.]